MLGQTVLHYRILDKIGEGGMGVVYRAQDTTLHRTVALKFLPEKAAGSEQDKSRFLQEARAAAVLNHPNICTIHAIEQHEGHTFIVMEHVEGVTLREKIPMKPAGAAFDAAIQIGEALAEAHSKGIVHRDIKSENIMITPKGQIKVMDFGLAKLKGSLKLIDVVTGKVTPLDGLPRFTAQSQLIMAPDDRALYFSRIETESDVWEARLR